MTKKTLKGIVIQGLGKGAYYTSLPQYRNFFERVLGGRIYPGTLNIKLLGMSWQDLGNFEEFKPKNGYGEVLYRLARIKGTGEVVMVIRPKRSSHDEHVIEIVARSFLRKKYNLKDDAPIELELI